MEKVNVEMTPDELKITLELLSRTQLTGKEVMAYAQVFNLFQTALSQGGNHST